MTINAIGDLDAHTEVLGVSITIGVHDMHSEESPKGRLNLTIKQAIGIQRHANWRGAGNNRIRIWWCAVDSGQLL